VEVSALTHAGGLAGTHARSPLLRLQGDERLIALIRRGNHHAFEALVGRYQARLLAFCRHMLNSREDAEDVLQEVFAAAFNAILADDRPINVRPWLYRIARNRSLNHLRKQTAIGVDSMDVHLSEHGLTTADKVHKREEFRQLMEDVQDLAETQRTALLLREIDALSYEQIAEAMETTIPSVKSLLVRARVSLAEAAEARLLTCDEVRDELGEVAEGLRRTSPPVRRHLRTCERCQGFRKQLRQTNKAMAALFPIGPLLLLKKTLLAHGAGAAAGSGSAAAAGGGAAAAAGPVAGAVASKAVAGLAAAAIVTAGAVEVKHVAQPKVAPVTQAAVVPAPVAPAPAAAAAKPKKHHPKVTKAVVTPAPAEPVTPPVEVVAVPPPAPEPVTEPVQEEGSTVVLPPREDQEPVVTPPAEEPTDPNTLPDDATLTPVDPPPAPPAGEPGSGQTPLPPPPALP
jgi:RNA polymerase sigma factor (sigma-70 family)